MQISKTRASQFGVSLLELMIGLVVAGLLASMAVPVLTKFVSAFRLDAQSDRFIGAVNLARSMAISNNTPVTLCALTSDGNCSDDPADWATRWSVFYDCNGNAGIDTGNVCSDGKPEPVYTIDEDSEAKWSLAMANVNNNVAVKIDFDSNGAPISTDDCWGVAFTLTSQDSLDPRTIYINNLGRAYVAEGNTTHGVTSSCDQFAVASVSSSGGLGESSSSGSSSSSSSSGEPSSSNSSGDDPTSSSTSSSSSGTDTSSSSSSSSGTDPSSGSSSSSSSSSGSSSSGGDPDEEPPFCTDCDKGDHCTKVSEENLNNGILVPLGNSGNYVTITDLVYKEDEKIGFTLLTSNNFQVKAGEDISTLSDEDQIVGNIEWGYSSDTSNRDKKGISHVIFCEPGTYQMDGDYTGFPYWEP
ncbi:MAG: Tfp pilus assembly protein FimT [Parasphingorhabdus sp.]|jgi:Tfp pilus assembly protein FimT